MLSLRRLRLPLGALLAALVGAFAACAPARVAAPPSAPTTTAPTTAQDLPSTLPSAASWIRHLERDLMPFWTQPAALGEPLGDFPTFRCHDGRAWDTAAPCPELAQAPRWIRDELGREYLRMRSRQSYLYGAAFHLTGDERYLELARAGALRIAAQVDADGSVPSWLAGGVPGPSAGERTTQDLAYAELGLAMYWYLTRDPAVLDPLVRLERHVFERSWRDDWGMLAWTREGPEAGRQELVAQLDQVNAYLLLVAPLLPEPHRARWQADLRRLVPVLVERYWSEELGMFWGRLDDPAERRPGGRHFDFGHTTKALWMLERIAVATGDAELARWARPRAARLLQRAFMAESGCWASAPRADGTLDRGLTWWTFAELDQTAATLALADRAQASYLTATAACWQSRLVDAEHGGVWAFADPDDATRHFGKQHQWKNGYHEAEHALVMAITAAALAGEPAALHFALPAGAPDAALRPYLFAGNVAARRPLGPSRLLPGHTRERVEFDAMR